MVEKDLDIDKSSNIIGWKSWYPRDNVTWDEDDVSAFDRQWQPSDELDCDIYTLKYVELNLAFAEY